MSDQNNQNMQKVLIFLVVALGISFIQELNAQSKERPWSITLTAGKSVYNGDRGNAIFDFDQPFQGMGGLRLMTYLNRSFDMSLGGTYGRHGYWEEDNQFLTNMLHANLMVHYKFYNGSIMSENSRLKPFLNLGLGVANYSAVDDRGEDATNLTIPFGIGARLALSESVDLFWMSNYGINFGDEYDLNTEEDDNDGHLHHQLGITFTMGKVVDSDNDGIADKKDRCPQVPGTIALMGCPDGDGDGITDAEDECPLAAGSEINNGCPDTDGDGILDKHDRCPLDAGSADTKGCPDRDGDGVVDAADDCPDVKGTARLKGCPDSDGDGVMDRSDACPDVKGSASADGCPDRDNDGIQDDVDDCPDTYGLARFGGCPDTDDDGIMDKKDKCPTIKGTAKNEGCPELSKETTTIFEEALRGINFETSRSIIKPKSFAILDKVVDVMRKNSNYQLSIEGHTDSQGDDGFNMQLSQDRARAVKAYLVKKGIASERMTALGFGETRPVADNNTKEGRALNRRVEFRVKF